MTDRLRKTLLAGAGFLLLQLGWILCIAPHYGIDEFDHAYRASSVAAGHWQPGNDQLPVKLGRGDLIPVRADVASSARAACSARPYTGTYNCRPKATLKDGEVLMASGASRYNPTFYAIVGTAALPFHGYANLYAMRIVTALLACALFMLTIWLAIGGAATVWPLLAVLLAALPTTVYSAAVVSPSGIELVAGLATWVALMAVVAPRGAQRRRSSYGALALASGVLVNAHTLGLLWLGLILGTVALMNGPIVTVRALLPKKPAEGLVAALAALAIAFELGWILLSGVNDPSLDQSTFTGHPWIYVARGLFLWPLQAIGAFPLRNDSAPLIVYGLVGGILTAFAVLALRRTRLRSRPVLALAFVALASYAVPAFVTVRTFHQIGAAWQGRYGMPFSVGLIIIIGSLLDASTRPAGRTRTFAISTVLILLVAQLISQWSVMTTQRSDFGLVAGTHWVPPSAALLLGLVVLAAWCWTAVLRTGSPVPPEVVPASARDEELQDALR